MISKIFTALRAVAAHPVNRDTKLKAIVDYCFSQVAVKLVPGDICVPFPNGTKLMISPRMKGAAHFINPGLCEFDEMSFVTHFLRPADCFMDVGANVGAYTVLASGLVGARTIAFEPIPETFRYLSANVRLNNLQSLVTARESALSDREGVIRMTDMLGTENYVEENASGSTSRDVPMTTLDRAASGCRVALLKIDVEGYETNVLTGAGETLRTPDLKAMVVERAGNGTRYGFDEAKLHDSLRRAGWIPCGYAPMTRKLHQLPPSSPGNIIYVRNLDECQRRVSSAPQFEFRGLKI